MRRMTVAAFSLMVAGVANAQLFGTSLTAHTPFGGGDGWLASADNPYTSPTDVARGMAYYQSGNQKELLVVSRANINSQNINIRRLDAETGVDLGGLNIGTGVISGGTFPVNMISTTADGQIFVANLITSSTASTLRVYRWANVNDTPTLVYSGDGGLAGVRLGDSMDARGTGSNVQLVFGHQTATAQSNGYTIVNYNGATGTAQSYTGLTGPGATAAAFRLGLTFGPGDEIWGGAGSATLRRSAFAGSTATMIGTSPLLNGNERIFDFRDVNGTPLLLSMDSGRSSNAATVTANAGTARVRVYDMTNPGAPVEIANGRIMTEAFLNTVSNVNGVGSITFGEITSNNIRIYAYAPQHGIQAFNLEVVPEPATMTALALGAAAMMRRRKKK